MKLKKVALFFVFSVFMFVSSVCFASITNADLEIGGIYYGQSMNEIVNKYGDSIRTIVTPPVGKEFVFLVNDSEATIRPEDGKVIKVTISGNSKLDTLKGIKIGSTFKETIALYGEPTFITNHSGTYCVAYLTPEIIINNSDVVYYHGVLRFYISDDTVTNICFYREYKYKGFPSDW